MSHAVRDNVRRCLAEHGVRDEAVERAIYNLAIHRCRINGAPCAWENVVFMECYKSHGLNIIRNAAYVKIKLEAGVPASEIVHKTPQEMNPGIWEDLEKQKRERDAAYGRKPVANTNMYQCRKCRSRECYFAELQTRSGDEPMTVFVTCLECGNRWRTE